MISGSHTGGARGAVHRAHTPDKKQSGNVNRMGIKIVHFLPFFFLGLLIIYYQFNNCDWELLSHG